MPAIERCTGILPVFAWQTQFAGTGPPSGRPVIGRYTGILPPGNTIVRGCHAS